MAKEFTKRQTRLLKIIEEENLSKQKQVKDRFEKKYGKSISQSTISREFNEDNLNVNCDTNGYYAPNKKIKLQHRRRQLEESLDQKLESSYSNVDLFSLSISLGYSKSIAHELELAFPEKIVGTVADGNTLLVITKSDLATKKIFAEIPELDKTDEAKEEPESNSSNEKETKPTD